MITPPKLSDMRYGHTLIAGRGTTTIVGAMDFETYSEAGFIWTHALNKFNAPHGATIKGLPSIGAAAYAEHPSTEVLSLAYDLKDGKGPRVWEPGYPDPEDLFDFLTTGNLIEAFNAGFEYWIWQKVCVPKYNWPEFPRRQLRCVKAKSQAFALPPSLASVGDALNTNTRKDKDGTRLLNKFSMPRDPTLKDKRTRIRLVDDPADAEKLIRYNIIDIQTEDEISSLVPDLSEFELKFWQCDHAINQRGVRIDTETVRAAIKIIEQAHEKYNTELRSITDGEVNSASEIQKIKVWIEKRGVFTASLDAENLELLLARPGLPFDVKRVLQIRCLIASAAVKKLYAMQRQVTSDGRLHDLFMYHAARTGRSAGMGPQPQNLPNSGPYVYVCGVCARSSVTASDTCAWCGTSPYVNDADDGPVRTTEWNADAVEDAITVIKTGSLEAVEYFFTDAVAAVSGCLRGMFIAAPGHELICSDYSAIEAVVLAWLAGEEWRLEVFRTHGKIYEASAAKISGIPLDEILDHYTRTKQHHPLRKKIGKVAELASGYQGWVGAWKQFGADEHLNDDEIKNAILAWRAASPRIVALWAGLESAAKSAIMNRGTEFSYRKITYYCDNQALYCKLPSGRYITYHMPRLEPSPLRQGDQITFMGWNTNPKNGAQGWARIPTYGGRLAENVTQAVSRDPLAHAIVALEQAGYPVVLHVHDEIVCETVIGAKTLDNMEKIMSTMPQWAHDLPVRATGGWVGKRYRK